MKNNIQKIAIIGLGYVGLPLAIEFGKKRPTLGYDINKSRIKNLINHNDQTREVTEIDFEKSEHIEFTDDPNDLKNCGIFIVTVPTPIDTANRPDLNPLISACETVGKSLQPGSIIIFESTVFPGCTEEICVPIIEKHSNLKFNVDFFCGYSPERINPGDKINTITKIRKITSGSTIESADFIDDLYKSIIEAGTFKASSIKVAEAAKVIENSQRDLNIAFVNELSLIFDRAGIDTIEVLEAAGSKWNFIPFRPGLVGGHCIGVDPYYLTHKAEELGYHPQVILAGRRINDNMASYVGQSIVRLMIKNGIDVAKSVVGIMGVTFKENCPDIRNSKVFDLIKELKTWNIDPLVLDPWADPDEVAHEYGVQLSNSFSKKLDALIVAVGHREFRELNLKEIRALFGQNKPVLADVKSLYERSEAEKLGITIFRL